MAERDTKPVVDLEVLEACLTNRHMPTDVMDASDVHIRRAAKAWLDQERAKNEMVTVTRVLTYSGPKWWVDQTLKKGEVPANGEYQPGPDRLIISTILTK